MPLKTRLDGRSENNDFLVLVDTCTGEIVAKIRAPKTKVELEIETIDSLHIEKPNGFSSNKGE